MFSNMIAGIEAEAVESVFKLQPKAPEKFTGVFSSVSKELTHPQAPQMEGEGAVDQPQDSSFSTKLSNPKVGRNDPCPCGSGKKYKKCCGQ